MKIKEVIRKKQNRLKKSLLGVLAVSATTVSLFPQTVMASGVSDVTQPLMNLKTLVISIIGAVGVIILAKNVMEFAQAGNIFGFRCICSGRSNSWCVGICVIQKLLTV